MPARHTVIGALSPILLIPAIAIHVGNTPRYFGGYQCTDRCRDHAAGFQWARQMRLKHPSQCSGPTQSYVQGCQTYSRDRMRDPSKDDSGQPID
jgi:hypothetical protein